MRWRGQHVEKDAFVMILARLHGGVLAVQLGSRVHRGADAELVNEFAHVLHLMAAEIDVIVAEVRLGKAVFERQTLKNFGVDHGVEVCAGHGRPADL